MAAATQADDEDVSNSKKIEPREQSSDENVAWVTLYFVYAFASSEEAPVEDTPDEET